MRDKPRQEGDWEGQAAGARLGQPALPRPEPPALRSPSAWVSRECGRRSTQPTTFPLERCVLGSQRQTFREWNSEAAINSRKETLTSRGAQSDGLNTCPAACPDGASQGDEPLLHRPSRTFSHDARPPPGLCSMRGQPLGLDSQLL